MPSWTWSIGGQVRVDGHPAARGASSQRRRVVECCHSRHMAIRPSGPSRGPRSRGSGDGRRRCTRRPRSGVLVPQDRVPHDPVPAWWWLEEWEQVVASRESVQIGIQVLDIPAKQSATAAASPLAQPSAARRRTSSNASRVTSGAASRSSTSRPSSAWPSAWSSASARPLPVRDSASSWPSAPRRTWAPSRPSGSPASPGHRPETWQSTSGRSASAIDRYERARPRCPAGPRVVVGLERLLGRPVAFRHVGEVHPDPVPERRPAAHAVDQDVGLLERGRGLGVPRLPALEPLERLGLRLRRARSR